MGVAGDRLEGKGCRWILPTSSRLPERQANVTTHGLGAEGAVAGRQRVEVNIAVDGLNVETLRVGRGDVNVAAGGLRGEMTSRTLNHQVAARGLERDLPAGTDNPN